jgi:N-acetylmuramoyl-L-alanine amidase
MIVITAGHHNNDPGAISNGFMESDLTKHLREKISSYISPKYKVVKDQDSWTLSQTTSNIKTGSGSVTFDIHFNAGSPSATGTEIFVPENATPNELKIAHKIGFGVSKAIGIKYRGLKFPQESQRKTLGIFKFIGINMLIEVCFITNKDDLDKYFHSIESVAKLIAEVLMEADDLH